MFDAETIGLLGQLGVAFLMLIVMMSLLFKFLGPILGTRKMNGRGDLMTKEARDAVHDIYNELKSKLDKKAHDEKCELIITPIKTDIEEIKASQQTTHQGIQDIQQTLINWNR